MRTETLTERADLVIRRLELAPGDATPWHVDRCRRFTVVVRGEKLGIQFRDSSEAIELSVQAGLAEWDEYRLVVGDRRLLARAHAARPMNWRTLLGLGATGLAIAAVYVAHGPQTESQAQAQSRLS